MKKCICLFFISLSISFAKADEGMWLLAMLDKLGIEQKGSNLTAEQIYSINNSSLKDAVLGLGEANNPLFFFCTAELVSAQGLTLTNYHCAFEMIQKHSSLSANFIENGFWAMKQSEELPNEGITATRFVKMIDVSASIMPLHEEFGAKQGKFKDMSKLNDTIAKVIAQLEQSVTDTSDYRASVKSFFDDNQYFLLVYEVFSDVRLVGAPPRSIGKFGGDTDNWTYPRHTGDFAVLRIYSDSTGKPAEYSPANKPYKARHFLPVSLKGYENNDFSMVLGFPGRTNRYLTSTGVDVLANYTNRAIISIGETVLATYNNFMQNDPAIKIKYAAKYDQMSNQWKYAIGQNRGIVRLGVVAQKQEQEKTLREWIAADSTRKDRYGTVLLTLEDYYSNSRIFKYADTYFYLGFLNAVEMPLFIYQCVPFLEAVQMDDPVEIKIQSIQLKNKADEFFNNYDAGVDAALLLNIHNLYVQNVPPAFFPPYYKVVAKKFKGDIKKYIDNIYSKSIFTNEQRFRAFIANPSEKVFMQDPGFEFLRNLMPTYFAIQSELKSPEYDQAKRLYFEALKQQHADSLFYPDANGSIRLSYGSVSDYSPRDAVHYAHNTTLAGVMEKQSTTNEEFFVPDKLQSLWQEKDFGSYANEKGEMPVCFITNNDITGGNSGSPVINSKGHLIGIAFDGNWEAMSGDIIYAEDLQKCIAVDIRYVLFIIDKFAGAGYLLNEMEIVR
ncbi:MAG: S46 family peptidase [Bacteroidetes bacterium]|nr:S46 family peptidase [Bacteroidota bacterium]